MKTMTTEKLKTHAILTVCLCGAISASAADLVGRYATITLDGSPSDWQAGDTLYQSSEISSGSPLNTTFTSVLVANDSNYLYVGLVTPAPATISDPWTYNLYLDTDMNSGTGFNAGWMTGGYDNLVEYGQSGTTYSVYSFGGGADQVDWNWNWDALIGYSYSDSLIEWAIPLSALGNPSQMRMEFNVTGSGVSTETWADQYESGVSTYTLATAPVPEPSALAMFGLGVLLLVSSKKWADRRGRGRVDKVSAILLSVLPTKDTHK